MSKGTSFARKQRREQFRAAGYLKIKNMYSRFSSQSIAWYNKMREDGNSYEEANQKALLDSVEEQLELRLKGSEELGVYGLRNTWADQGYNSEEIAKLEEAWISTNVKDSDWSQRRADKKKARSLQKEVQQSRAARSNANN